ncbi:MAG: AI-2E family transporter [Candidatus Parcubacteria bacterium]|nr:AI-2E family transporter [Candidatus Parcubacteria bacterium]
MLNGKAAISKESFSNIFLLVILGGILYLCYLLLRPFLYEIIIAGVLVTIFYQAYLKIVFWTRGQLILSSFIICLLIFLILIIPFSFFLYYLSYEALNLYSSLTTNGAGEAINQFFNSKLWQEINFKTSALVDMQKFLIDIVSFSKSYVLSGASALITGLTNFIISLIVVFFTMFFLFIEGRTLLRRIMQLTPLSNKYDKLIWIKFHDVSYTTIVASFATAFAQAAVGAVGFLIVGLPPLLAAVLIFIFSFVPYIGTVIVWLPACIYLLAIGHIWQGAFMFIWGALVISLIDNVIRPILIKNKAQVHPMIIFFAIFGGISMMGFWGVIFGPLIVALTITILHIYEMQYSNYLEKK